MSEMWPEVYDMFDRLCGFTSALADALDAEQAQMCDIMGSVDSAITLYLNGPTMILVALIVGGTALMIAIVAPNGEPWQYTCCEYRPRYSFCNVV